MHCGNYAYVDNSIIQDIRRKSGKKGFIQPSSKLRPGDQVVVKAGPFKDYAGIFKYYLDDTNRVKILMNMARFQSYLVIEDALIEVL